MQWNQSFTLGIKEIDDEHRNLVRMISKLQNSLNEGMITRQTGIVIKELVDYTKYHFRSEEKFMEQIHFVGLERHKLLHEELVKSVIGILEQLKQGKQITSIDLIEFLKKWLKDHILDEDMKIGIFYENILKKAQDEI